ncbi:hypothetical protein G5714_003997 [Onychostoma macrolepis]|uniref:CxC3 like cysteine cluster domain-containing protein n=1 Tax=Onychostoma macrolepis TaxID=369639 RepID=A0A7J6DB01_9TELE|nr:hypothetical protein G5714_003997 [Onychostoma macrolepis]
MCRDCLPRSLYCTACDLSTHEALVLHNRASIVEGFFRHLPPSTFVQQHEGGKFSYHEKDCMLPIVPPCCDCSTGQTSFSKGKPVILIGMNGRYNLFLPSVNCSCGKTLPVTISDLVESGYWPATVNFETLYLVDLFTTYEDLKITAPGMSRQAFVSTKLFGRSGKICGDTMKFEVDKLSQVQHFQCPACTPSMLAVAVDGNRKLYRFKSQPGPDGFFDGVFLANDAEVSSFVDYIHGTTGHNPGKGRCGAGQWTAARESANKSASKLDEEGVEVAVCRHGVLLKGLNMFRGEIFAYPLYLQKQLASQTVQFFCSDVVCKYWPYLQKVVDHCPELEDLLNMRPFLSIMHAKAHSWMCELKWGGRNQEGAGTTIGEEVEQVNSFLSRAAICSKYMSKAVRTDMLTIQASGWNKRKAENLDRTLAKRYIKTVQRIAEATKDLEKLTAELSLQQDTVQQWVSDVQQWTSGGNKRRHQLRRKIAVEKKALEVAINDHNATVGEVEKLPPPNELLAVDNYSWPWECHGDMERKKNVFDKVMLLARLKEEEFIVVREVKQHMEYMRSVAGLIEEFTFQLTGDTNGKCSTEGLMEKGREGLLCVLKRRLCEVEAQLATARTTYKSFTNQQPTTSPPPIQSTISPPPIQSTIQPTTSPPPIQSTIQPTTSPPPIQSTIQPTTSPPPIQSTIQPTTSPPPIQSTTSPPPIQSTTSPPPVQSTIQLTTSSPILPIMEPPQQKRECNHGILEGEPYYPVKRVIRCKKQKGIQMKLVEWEPCSLCEKTWPPQWVTEENTTN